MSCKAIEPCLRHSVSRSCDKEQSVPIMLFAAWWRQYLRLEAYRDVQIVVDLDHLAEDADPLVQVGKIE